MIRFCFVCLISFFAVSTSFGQSAQLKKGLKLFDEFKFVKALDAFIAAYEKEENAEALVGIVNSYKKMGALSEAESYLKKLVDAPSVRPVYLLNYGQALLSNGKYQEALLSFQKYSELVPSDSRGKSFIEMADNYLVISKSQPEMQVLSLEINSPYDDYSPCFFKDGFVFSSDRGGIEADKVYEVTGRPFSDLFFTPSDGNLKHSTVGLWGGKINTYLHEGTCAFSPDAKKVYFTRDNYFNRKVKPSSDDIVKLKIFSAADTGRPDGEWELVDEIPFNDDDYSVMHPALSADGNALYFASDMPGGYGETDIYVSYRVGSSWGAPENLGAKINSEGRDQFPFIADNGILYYASDGIAGLGGLDIFASQLNNGVWSTPNNMGSPINSNADDFGLIIETVSQTGYFTSRRSGGVGLDDIYSFQRVDCIVLNGYVFDETSGEAIAGASVMMRDESGQKILETTSDADGLYNTCITADNKYTAYITHPIESDEAISEISTYNYKSKTAELKTGFNIVVQEVKEEEPVEEVKEEVVEIMEEVTPIEVEEPAIEAKEPIIETNEIKESPVVIEKTVIAESVNTPVTTVVETCYLSGRIYTKDSGDAISNSKITLQATNGGAKETYTDSYGYYSLSIEAGNTYKVYATADNFYTANETITVTTDNCSQNLDLTLEGIVMNQAVTLNNIYYNFNKSAIRQDAIPELENLVSLLSNNPGVSVTIYSFTDSRGTDSQNLELSQRRAKSVVDYLISKGINANRLTSKGLGESELINECTNDVTCTDEQHQANRRTVFKVTGYESGVLISESLYNNGNIYGTQTTTITIDK